MLSFLVTTVLRFALLLYYQRYIDCRFLDWYRINQGKAYNFYTDIFSNLTLIVSQQWYSILKKLNLCEFSNIGLHVFILKHIISENHVLVKLRVECYISTVVHCRIQNRIIWFNLIFPGIKTMGQKKVHYQTSNNHCSLQLWLKQTFFKK